jgi:inner membrane protein
MAVRFLTPNDFYQKAWRASRYGLLFIGLTFLTILLLERGAARPAHPVQYLMVGLAQATFVLLMVAYAEQIGFGPAYAAASAATIGLIAVFGATGLSLGRKAVGLGGVLTLLYGVFFLILRSTDYALLAGSTLAFLALAGTMLLTRNETWEGPARRPGWPWGKRRPDKAAPV